MDKIDSKTNNKIYPGLVAETGEYCKNCGKLPHETPENQLFINFRDNQKSNEDMSNLLLMCAECTNMRFILDIPNIEMDPRPCTPEMKKNIRMEPLFRNWLRGIIETRHKIPVDEAINSGAEYVSGSPETIKRYIKKLTSNTGNYRIVIGQRGILFIEWKD